jgi:hypothetical protein
VLTLFQSQLDDKRQLLRDKGAAEPTVNRCLAEHFPMGIIRSHDSFVCNDTRINCRRNHLDHRKRLFIGISRRTENTLNLRTSATASD